MPLFTCGINYQSASIEWREKVAFNATRIPEILQDLLRLDAVNEAVLLSTCNRTEIYSHADHSDALKKWFLDCHGEPSLANVECYVHQDIDAVRHLLRVASGLDSMVLGEPQIFGQIKQAYQLAYEAGGVKDQLKQLFPAVFAASKQIRSETNIGANPISYAYATVQLAKRIFSDLKNCRVLLVGVNAMIELVATHLQSQQVSQLIFANRTLEKSDRLAEQFRGQSIRIGDIPAYLSQTDILVTATASQLPIIGKGMVERVTKSCKRRPIFMVDLAVPRDIEPEVRELADIYLYNIDDLQAVVEANSGSRREAAKQAEMLVEMQAEHYMRQLHILNASGIIRSYRQQAELVRDQALSEALVQLQKGRDPLAVVSGLAHSLTNKLLHQPTVKLREAAYHQQADLLLLAKDLLDIE